MLCPCFSVVFDKELPRSWKRPTLTNLEEGIENTNKVSYFQQEGSNSKIKWKVIEVGAWYSCCDNSKTSNKYSYVSKNYMGKIP